MGRWFYAAGKRFKEHERGYIWRNCRQVGSLVEDHMNRWKLSFSVITSMACVSMIAGCNLQTTGKKDLPPHLVKIYKKQNDFVNDIFVLHKKVLAEHEFYTTEEVGGYGGFTNDLEFYKKVNYYDSTSNRLLSEIRWEKITPDNIHMINVFVYDAQGRLKREYFASYLPSRRTSPLATYIALHNYNNYTHSFREFDYSNTRVYEQCEGVKSNKNIYFAFHYEDIPESYLELDVKNHDLYRACFDHADSTAEPFISQLNDLSSKNRN